MSINQDLLSFQYLYNLPVVYHNHGNIGPKFWFLLNMYDSLDNFSMSLSKVRWKSTDYPYSLTYVKPHAHYKLNFHLHLNKEH